MLLTVDIGNTNIVIGIFKGDELIYHWRIGTAVKYSTDEYMIKFYNLFKIAGIDYRKEIKGIIIGSVVPELVRKIEKAYFNLTGISPVIADVNLDWGMKIRYDIPSQVGVDRLLNSLAAKKLYGIPTLIVDFGTATTIDVVSEEGNYEGGTISPGINISTEALFEKTAKLPHISIAIPKRVLGKNTVESMRSGILLGTAGQVKYLIEKIKEENPSLKKSKIIFTGGFSRLMEKILDFLNPIIDPFLTLKGLKLLYYKNNSQS